MSGGAIAAIVVCVLLAVVAAVVFIQRRDAGSGSSGSSGSSVGGIRMPQWAVVGSTKGSTKQRALKKVDTMGWLRESASATDTI
jgi:hypothetical protein